MQLEPDDFDTSPLGIPALNNVPTDEEATLIAVPDFLTAGYTEQESSSVPINTGLYPPGYEISSSLSMEGRQINQVINYYFPVEIEVIGASSDAELDRFAQYVYQELNNALQDYNFT
jgi:hypothetical protein